ncbi:hypothetical protein BDN72DRAFT_289177 [Pluteus cervinus]|uniref:Uncharacterized protein n=1 Tax=Pluteus cervinus TaxID=181527 RepID=A0ACD3AE46_9AGAR|nr:hypothetical protein BDN72DRAFT_289177 [Pluteus cervinus]
MATTSLLDTIPPQVLHTLNQLTAQSTSTMTDHQSGLLRAVKELVQAHPRATASAVVIGFVVMCNPLAMIGFGRKGPGSGNILHHNTSHCV